ncbi:MAG: lipopolysaccharide heptosyltransferase I [Thiomicrorhabdus chilensis]|uniref:lipopolysaccharide heptosyltransferase I n=1 Tax=Thiomicrorhabdus chilensis TaxID=63656 RepID=UPI00299D94D9|nr:lipopolysaccharide heptosyltransferase I [Thiomicrorhabdus chilensis]MDX1347266.1 lipopolysaccharide heptosyltransferase I [Thiomicrorhabdus chilensis]
MRILLIKMSSMGDVFHTFPALSDALAAIPGLKVDWVVEKSFAEIPTWHPAVDTVYPIELRKWRKSLFSGPTRQEIKAFFDEVNQTHYDLILDAQGLYKSVWVGRRIRGSISGFDLKSAREPLASLFYQHKYAVAKNQHAILRLRQLFAQALNYSFDDDQPIVYGLNTQAWSKPEVLPAEWEEKPYLVFLHGTTWETKYWPEEYWIELLNKVNKAGFKVVLPWGNDEEHERALRLSDSLGNGHTPEVRVKTWVPEQALSLSTVAQVLKFSKGVVSVDTGLSHVAAALEVPMVVLYRVTDPKLVGADGSRVVHLQSPCAPLYLKRFAEPKQEENSLKGLSVDLVYQALQLK